MIKGMFGSKVYEVMAALVIAAVIAGIIWLTAHRNYQAGYQAATLAFEQEAKQTLQIQLDHLNAQLEAANQTHLSMLKKVSEYQAQGEQTTDELQKILAKTASRRVDCRFDADSLQRLDAARKRAADAATRGFNPAVPDAAGTHGR